MKNIIHADCSSEEIEDFKKGLEEVTKEKYDIISDVSNWGRTNIWLKIKRYLVYFVAPLKIFFKRKKYKRIVGWQQFYAISFCFYCMLFHVKKINEVHVVNFTYNAKKGLIGKLYYKYMRRVLNSKYVDYIYVPSNEYIKNCSKLLNIDSKKFVMLPFGIPDRYEKYKNNKKEGQYVLSIGRSNRDYEWLVKAWKNIKYDLLIICDTFDNSIKITDNIKVIDNVSGDDQFPYIMGCEALVLPIKIESLCSGDTTLLSAMSFKKNVIVTENSTLAELYVKDKKNGFVVKKDNRQLKEVIDAIFDKKLDCSNEARKDFLNKYSRFNMGKNVGKTIIK